ncbi:unnamed protein product [Hymenolepis diminuta]|uniref:Secreted protein n=1 Tax=Hymenolepis diminuta TaxID=6216 RepID=A0A0R3SS29_HYMDI|nr:unnamed protein product [Hymenolepis diminuta]
MSPNQLLLLISYLTSVSFLISVEKSTEYPCLSYCSITCIQPSDSHLPTVLRKFPDLTDPDKPVNHSVTTHGNLVKPRARHLFPTRHEITKDEFERILGLGISCRSSSNWSSALPSVHKKSGDWGICADYRALNLITIPDNYSIPNIQSFSCKIFFSMMLSVKLFSRFMTALSQSFQSHFNLQS